MYSFGNGKLKKYYRTRWPRFYEKNISLNSNNETIYISNIIEIMILKIISKSQTQVTTHYFISQIKKKKKRMDNKFLATSII